MKKIITILMGGVMVLGITGCSKSNKEFGDEPLSSNTETIFIIKMGNKGCVPVQLSVYEDGTYELFTTYGACRSGQTCTLMLKYTKSIKGTYDYDVNKIIENSVDADKKSYSMDNLPEYEIYMGNPYVEQGYSYYYTIEKEKTNKYLDEFLNEIDVDLKVCANPEYT